MRVILNNNKSVSRLVSVESGAIPEFIFKIDTSLGNGLNTYVFQPLAQGVINYTIFWGDGSNTFVNTNTNSTHNYSSAGIYEIKISVISGMYNYSLGFTATDYLKVIEIVNFGTYQPGAANFYAIGSPNGIINFTDVFVINGASQATFQAVTINNINLNLNNCTSLFNAFRKTNALDWSFLLDTEIPNITNMTNMMSGTNNNFDNSTYQLLLVHWTGWNGTTATKTLKNNVPAHFGTAKYENGGQSQDARSYLINTLGWTITDGGGI